MIILLKYMKCNKTFYFLQSRYNTICGSSKEKVIYPLNTRDSIFKMYKTELTTPKILPPI